MTRNHEKLEPYRLAGLAQAQAGVVRQQSPLAWARSIHTQLDSGDLRPRTEPGDKAKTIATIQRTTKAELVPVAIKTLVRGENELRLRAIIRAVRALSASGEAKDQKHGRELASFLGNVWGVRIAAEVVSEGEVEAFDKLTEEWGKAQLPPAGATVNQWVADELLISAAVRRLG
jgi:hypothetical protein